MTLDNLFKLVLLTSAMGSIIALLVFLIKVLFKNKLSLTWHYYIWLIVIIRLLVPYSLSSSFSVFNFIPIPFHDSIAIDTMGNKPQTDMDITPIISNTNNLSNAANINSEGSINKNTINNIKPINQKVDYLKILCIIWISGTLLSILYILISYYAFAKKIKLSPVCIDEDLAKALAHSKAIMGVNHNIELVYSRTIKSPALTGVIKPKIILPVDTFKDLSEEEKSYIFMHELIHLKRKDIVLNWIITLLLCIHWFNPIIWISFSKVKEDCELSCDAETLKHINPEEYIKYGETLIKLVNTIKQSNLTPGTTAIVNKSEIKRRIIMISKFKKSSLIWSVIAIIVTLAVGCGTLTNSKSSTNLNNSSVKKVNENQTTSNAELTGINSSTKTNPISTDSSKNNTSPETVKVKSKVKLYEGTYFDDKRFGENMLKTYCEVVISNVTDNSFDFTVYQVVDAAKGEKKVIFLKNTAVFIGDGTKAAFNGKNYTINFAFPNYHRAYPVVTDMEISGFPPLEGNDYVNNGIPGHEFG